jgi:dephospho-CoA kinase
MTTNNYLKIGLTGGIGSGKTTAAARFAALGAHVYHADEVARHALDPGAVCYDRVVSEFGTQILQADQTIDRRKLGEIVFADESKRQLLNSIIHPYVIGELFLRAERDLASETNGIAVFEVPLLFESGMHQMMDCNIVVTSPEEDRIRRVMERDNLTREQVIARIRSQMPEEEKVLLADYVLKNDSTQENFLKQVDALYDQWIAGGLHA